MDGSNIFEIGFDRKQPNYSPEETVSILESVEPKYRETHLKDYLTNEEMAVLTKIVK